MSNNARRVQTTSEYIAAGFRKIDADLATLMRCLRGVLEGAGEGDVARLLPWMEEGIAERDAASLPPNLEQAYSIAFQLLNMVEENTAARTRRLREMEGVPEPGCWHEQLRHLVDAGFGAADIAAALPEIRVDPVLTAHPTEAKRASVLEQHRAIYALLSSLENPALTPVRREAVIEDIKVAIERLWRSGEILLEKPAVASEHRGVLFYLTEVFPQVLPELDDRLRRAWDASGLDRACLEDPHAWPRLRFSSWVGGDRDGHPLVTDRVTAETLGAMRRAGLGVIRRHLERLARDLPLSGNFQPPPAVLTGALHRMAEENPRVAAGLAARYSDEPWRQYVGMLCAKLPAAGDDGGPAYRTPRELDAGLVVLAGSLEEVGAGRLARHAVRPVRRALDVFGFHLAALDIRQNSRFHDLAIAQILAAAGREDSGYPDWPEERRLGFLERELASPEPLLPSPSGIGAEAGAVLGCYAVLRDHIRAFGRGGIGSLIVSMTRRLSDLLGVYLLAREGGLMRWGEEGGACVVPVVPLFETLGDLEASAGLIGDFLDHPVTRRSLRFQQTDRANVLSLPHTLPIQQVMIGYSDSNKDCGTLASQWALHNAQDRIARAGRARGTRIRFFHGRGGTISRGAGPTHRFLEALPAGSIRGDLRLTEQGETIAQKYSNLETATHNLELLMAGVTGLSARENTGIPAPDTSDPAWEILAASSRQAYRRLIEDDHFMPFYSGATPIDALETSSIGSRPARRTGRRSLDDLRAIPWVFSWNQSRFYLPGWYGVGSALEALAAQDPPAMESLRAHIRQTPFAYYLFTNVETNLASADEEIMGLYAGLVTDPAARTAILEAILHEFHKTGERIADLFGAGIATRRPRMFKTLGLRAHALRVLHIRQISLLSNWRQARDADPAAAERLLPRVLLSVNAIASGLRTTG